MKADAFPGVCWGVVEWACLIPVMAASWLACMLCGLRVMSSGESTTLSMASLLMTAFLGPEGGLPRDTLPEPLLPGSTEFLASRC